MCTTTYGQTLYLCWNIVLEILIISLHKKWSFPSRNFFSKYDQIRSFLQIWSHLLKKCLRENFIFWAVYLFELFNFGSNNASSNSIASVVFLNLSIAVEGSCLLFLCFLFFVFAFENSRPAWIYEIGLRQKPYSYDFVHSKILLLSYQSASVIRIWRAKLVWKVIAKCYNK